MGSFVADLLAGRASCEREATYLDPLGAPLCSECAQQRKEDHETGRTPMSMLLRDESGTIPPYKLTPIQ